MVRSPLTQCLAKDRDGAVTGLRKNGFYGKGSGRLPGCPFRVPGRGEVR